MKKTLSMLALILAAGVYNVNAQSSASNHMQNQKERVKQGVRSGELTKSEVKDIHEDRQEIRQDVRLAKADGDITAGEKKIIKKEIKQSNKNIYRKKHNNRDRN